MVRKYYIWSKLKIKNTQSTLHNNRSVIWLLFSQSGCTQTSIGSVTVDFSQLFRKVLLSQLLHNFVMMSNNSGLYTWCLKKTFSLLVLLKLLLGYCCPTHSNLLIHSKWELTIQSGYVLQLFSFVKQMGGSFVYYFLYRIHLPCSSIYLGTTAECKSECKLLCPQLLPVFRSWWWASETFFLLSKKLRKPCDLIAHKHLKCAKRILEFIHKTIGTRYVFLLPRMLINFWEDRHKIQACCVKQGEKHFLLYTVLILRVGYDGWLTLNFWEFKELDFTLFHTTIWIWQKSKNV